MIWFTRRPQACAELSRPARHAGYPERERRRRGIVTDVNDSPGPAGPVQHPAAQPPTAAQYTEPNTVDWYDTLNAGRWDTDHYLAVAARIGSADVADIGCGTGSLAVDLAAAGQRVTGVDPAAEMLAVARSRPGGDAVHWLHGDATALATGAFDLLVMTGHVAQVFLDDEAWNALLVEAHRALRPGGRLAFESRDPAARGWTRWNPVDSRRSVEQDGRTLTSWHEVTDVRDEPHGPIVRYDTHDEVDGRRTVDTDTLRFPTQEYLRESLAEHSFEIEELLGDWDGSAVGPGSPELIVLARR